MKQISSTLFTNSENRGELSGGKNKCCRLSTKYETQERHTQETLSALSAGGVSRLATPPPSEQPHTFLLVHAIGISHTFYQTFKHFGTFFMQHTYIHRNLHTVT